MDIKCALRQTILYQCPSWAWDNIVITGSGYTPDLEHRISMIPAEANGVLHIRENANANENKEVRINDFLVTVLEAGANLNIDAEARYASEMTGQHAKYSQHICDAELNIETSTSMSEADIMRMAHDILLGNLVTLRDEIVDQAFSQRLTISDGTSIAANLWHCHIDSYFFQNDLIIEDVGNAMKRLQHVIQLVQSHRKKNLIIL